MEEKRPEGLYLLAVVRYKEGKKEEAREALKKIESEEEAVSKFIKKLEKQEEK